MSRPGAQVKRDKDQENTGIKTSLRTRIETGIGIFLFSSVTVLPL
jgi:hypothetical protein